MRKSIFLIVVLGMFVSAEAGTLLHYDFTTTKNTTEAWEYEDISGSGRHGNEAGSFYNYNGDLNEYADMWEANGGADWTGASRNGVYAYRWALETDYDASLLTDPQIDGQWLEGAGAGSWDNNRLTFSTPTIAVNDGITIALWVNPETNHIGEKGGSPNTRFCHLVGLGRYGNYPIATLALQGDDRLLLLLPDSIGMDKAE